MVATISMVIITKEVKMVIKTGKPPMRFERPPASAANVTEEPMRRSAATIAERMERVWPTLTRHLLLWDAPWMATVPDTKKKTEGRNKPAGICPGRPDPIAKLKAAATPMVKSKQVLPPQEPVKCYLCELGRSRLSRTIQARVFTSSENRSFAPNSEQEANMLRL